MGLFGRKKKAEDKNGPAKAGEMACSSGKGCGSMMGGDKSCASAAAPSAPPKPPAPAAKVPAKPPATKKK